EEVISTEITPLSSDDAAQCVDPSANFDIAAPIDKEIFCENAANNETVLDIAIKQGRVEIAKCRQSVLEEEISTEKTPSGHDDSTQCAESSVHSENIEFIEHENPDENDAGDEIVQGIATETALEERTDFIQPVMEEEIFTVTNPSSCDEVAQCADSSIYFENPDVVEKENCGENAVGDEIAQDIATENGQEEIEQVKQSVIGEDICTLTIPLTHEDAARCADSSVHIETIDLFGKENLDEDILQDTATEPTMEDTVECNMSGRESTISTVIIPLTTHEIGQHEELATQSDPKIETNKEIFSVFESDDINMQDPSIEDFDLRNITTVDPLKDIAKSKLNGIEDAISEVKIHLTSHEDVLVTELAAKSDGKHDIDERRLSVIDTDDLVLQEIVRQRKSDECTEGGFLEFDPAVEMETLSSTTHKSVQYAELAAKSDAKYDNIKEDFGENAVDDKISQVIASEHALEKIAEFKQSGNEEKISTEIIPLSHVDADRCTEAATTLDSTNFIERKNYGELDEDDINPQYMARESLLEEGFESRHLEIEKEVEMEATPLITHEARKYSNSDIHFDNIDLIDKECLADIDVHNIILQDTALESVSYEGAEIRNHQCENEISTEKIAMSQDKILQSAESGTHFDTVDYIDNESRAEINTNDINLHEMATEKALGEGDKSIYPQIEEKTSMEIITSTNDEVVQCANSDAVQATICDLKEENFDEFNACGAFVENSPSEGLSEPTNIKHAEFNRETFIEINSLVNNEAMQRANPDPFQIVTSDTNEENIGELFINDVNQEAKCSEDLSEKYTERRYFGNENEALFELNPLAKNNIYQSVNAIASLDNKGDFSEENWGDPTFQDAKTEMDFLNQELEISDSSQSQEKEKSINDKEVTEISESKLMLNKNKLSLRTEDKTVRESNQLLKAISARQNSSVIDDAVQSGRLNTPYIVAGDGSKVILEELATQDRNVGASPALKLSGASEDSDSKNEKIRSHEITMVTQDVVENFASKAKETKKREYVDVDSFEVNNEVSTEQNILAKFDDVNLESSEISFGSVGEIIKEDLAEPAIRVDNMGSGSSINELEASQCSELKTKNSSDEKIEIDAIEVPQLFLSKSEYENVEEFALNELTNKVKEVSIELPPGTNYDAIKSGISNYAMNTSGDLPDQTLGASFGQKLSEGIHSSKILEVPENSNILSELNNEEKKADDEIIARQIEQLLKPCTDKEKHQMCYESRLLSPELHGTTYIPDKDCKKQHYEKPNETEDSPNHPSKVSLSLQVASSNNKKNKKSDKGVIYEIEKKSKLGPIVKSLKEADENFVSSELLCVEVHSLDNTINENRKELIVDNTVSHSFLNKKSTGSDSTNPCSYDSGVTSPRTHLVSGTGILPEPDEKLTTASSTSLPCIENSNISDELSHSKLAVTKAKKKKKKKKVGKAGSPDSTNESFSKSYTETLSNSREISESFEHKAGETEDFENIFHDIRNKIASEDSEQQNLSKYESSVSTLEQPLASKLEAADILEHSVAEIEILNENCEEYNEELVSRAPDLETGISVKITEAQNICMADSVLKNEEKNFHDEITDFENEAFAHPNTIAKGFEVQSAGLCAELEASAKIGDEDLAVTANHAPLKTDSPNNEIEVQPAYNSEFLLKNEQKVKKNVEPCKKVAAEEIVIPVKDSNSQLTSIAGIGNSMKLYDDTLNVESSKNMFAREFCCDGMSESSLVQSLADECKTIESPVNSLAEKEATKKIHAEIDRGFTPPNPHVEDISKPNLLQATHLSTSNTEFKLPGENDSMKDADPKNDVSPEIVAKKLATHRGDSELLLPSGDKTKINDIHSDFNKELTSEPKGNENCRESQLNEVDQVALNRSKKKKKKKVGKAGSPDSTNESFSKSYTETLSNSREISESFEHKAGETEDFENIFHDIRNKIASEDSEQQNLSKYESSVSTLEQPLASKLEAADILEHSVSGKETADQISDKDIDLVLEVLEVSQSSDLILENRLIKCEKGISPKSVPLTKKSTIRFTSSEIGKHTIQKIVNNMEISLITKALYPPKYFNLAFKQENTRGASIDGTRGCEKGELHFQFQREANINNNDFKSLTCVVDKKDMRDECFNMFMRERITEECAAKQNLTPYVSEARIPLKFSFESNTQEKNIGFRNSESMDEALVEINLGSMNLMKSSKNSDFFSIGKVILDNYVLEFHERLQFHKIEGNESLGFRTFEISNSPTPKSVISYIYLIGCSAFSKNINSESLDNFLQNLMWMIGGGEKSQLSQRSDSSNFSVTHRGLRNLRFSGNFKPLSIISNNKKPNYSSTDKSSRSYLEISLGNFIEPVTKYSIPKFLQISEDKRSDPKDSSSGRQREAYIAILSNFCDIPFIQNATEDTNWLESFPLKNEDNGECNDENRKILTGILPEDSSCLVPFEASLEPYFDRLDNEFDSLKTLYFARNFRQISSDESQAARSTENFALEEVLINEELSMNPNDVKKFCQTLFDKNSNAKLLISSNTFTGIDFTSSHNSNYHEKKSRVDYQDNFNYHQSTDTCQVLGRDTNYNEDFNQVQSTPQKFDSVVRKKPDRDFAKVLKLLFRQDPMNYGELLKINSSPVDELKPKFDSFALQKNNFNDKLKDELHDLSSDLIKHEKAHKIISNLSLEQPIKPLNLCVMSDSISNTTSDLNLFNKAASFQKRTGLSVTELSPIFQSVYKKHAEEELIFFKKTNLSVEPGISKLKTKEKCKNVPFCNSELFLNQSIFSEKSGYQNNSDKSEKLMSYREFLKIIDSITGRYKNLFDLPKIYRESFWLKHELCWDNINTHVNFKDDNSAQKTIETVDNIKYFPSVSSVRSHLLLELDNPKTITSNSQSEENTREYKNFHHKDNDSCIKLLEKSLHAVQSNKRPIRNFVFSEERFKDNRKSQKSEMVTVSAKILQNGIFSSNTSTAEIGLDIFLGSIMISAKVIMLSRTIDLKHSNLFFPGVNTDKHKPLAIKWPLEDLEISSSLISCIANSDISKERFRPSIDPQNGKFLPLPLISAGLREDQSRQSLEKFAGSYEVILQDLNSGDQSKSDTQSNTYSSSAQCSSQISIPLDLYFRKREKSDPSSSKLYKPSLDVLFQPTSQFSFKFLRSRSRQTSWNRATGFQPLYLLETNIQSSTRKSKIEDLQTLAMGPNTSQDSPLEDSNLEKNKEDEKTSDFFLDCPPVKSIKNRNSINLSCLQDRTGLISAGNEEALFSTETTLQSVKTAKFSPTGEHLTNEIEQRSNGMLKRTENYKPRNEVINNKLSTKKEIEITSLDQVPKKASLNNQVMKTVSQGRIRPLTIKNDTIHEQLVIEPHLEKTPYLFSENPVKSLPNINKPADKVEMKHLDHNKTVENESSLIETPQISLANEQNFDLEKFASTVVPPKTLMNEDSSLDSTSATVLVETEKKTLKYGSETPINDFMMPKISKSTLCVPNSKKFQNDQVDVVSSGRDNAKIKKIKEEKSMHKEAKDLNSSQPLDSKSTEKNCNLSVSEDTKTKRHQLNQSEKNKDFLTSQNFETICDSKIDYSSAMNMHEHPDLALSRKHSVNPLITETKECTQIKYTDNSKYSQSKSPRPSQNIQVNIKNEFPNFSISQKSIKPSRDLSKNLIPSFKNNSSSQVGVSKLPTLNEERQLESTEYSKESFIWTNNKEKKQCESNISQRIFLLNENYASVKFYTYLLFIEISRYSSREEIGSHDLRGEYQRSSEYKDTKNQFDLQSPTSFTNEIIIPAEKSSDVAKEIIPHHGHSRQNVEEEKAMQPRRISSYSGNIKNKGLVQHCIQKFKSFDESQNLCSKETKFKNDSLPQKSNRNITGRFSRQNVGKSEEKDSGSYTGISSTSQDINIAPSRSETQKRPLNKESSLGVKKKSKIESSIPDSMILSQSLRRNGKKTSGDLRSISQQEGKTDQTLNDPSLAATNPQPNEGRARVKTMADVYDGLGEGYITSPRSPTRPHSLRRRQSMKLLDLESQVESLIEQNRNLVDEKGKIEQQIKTSLQTSLTNKDVEIERLNRTLAWLKEEVSRFKKLNQSLDRENSTIAQQHMDRNAVLENQRTKLTQELDQIRDSHQRLTLTYQKEIESIVQAKDRIITELRTEVDNASQRIKDAHKQILLHKTNDAEFLNLRDVRYFSDACHRLCQHVQQWVLRFSKYSDMKSCRLTREIKNDKIVERLDNSILDGINVDNYLSDRIKRRDVFMSMVMTMIWEYIFTRYLFGMDRDQRQKLKSLEKTLSEVGPALAVQSWRSITLTLLSKRLNFIQQKEQDTQAVVHAIIESLSEILPLPCNYEAQIQEQLSRVIKEAVDLSIEMRCQKAEYVMFPPLQPEYDVNGEIVSKVMFNPTLMNERSNDNTSNEDTDPTKVHIRIVLFPLVIKRGDNMSRGNEDIIVYPAQVLAAKPKRLAQLENDNRSRISIKSNSPAAKSDKDLI
ncbi:hypothetical protein GcM1_249061, partial [Golovinomyces cichoracearum]